MSRTHVVLDLPMPEVHAAETEDAVRAIVDARLAAVHAVVHGDFYVVPPGGSMTGGRNLLDVPVRRYFGKLRVSA